MSARRRGPALALWLVVLVAPLLAVAVAQGATSLADVAIGYRGEAVAEAWNPVRVVLRDVGAGSFELVVDQGSLREGERPWTVTVPFPGGAGVRVLDLDVYLPVWRSLRWVVDAGGTIVASGALDRASADRRPVDLVVSTRAGEVAQALAGRVVDVVGSDLPARAAAFGGVRSVWIDGTAELPEPAALAAAAAGGAIVVVQGAAVDDPALAPVRALADGGWWPSGVGGWWFGAAPSDVELTAARIDVAAVATAFAASHVVALPTFPPPARVAVVVAVYVVLVFLGWRLGGAVGLATWGWAVVAASVVATTAWRPPSTAVVEARVLNVAGGELALEQRALAVLTLPAGAVAVDVHARPAAVATGGSVVGRTARTEVALARWRGATLLEPPRAAAPVIAWGADGLPRAIGPNPLRDVRIVGGDAWARLEPGRPPGAPSDPSPPTAVVAAFEALLPPGSAWARDDAGWYALLPPAPPFAAEVGP
ncbi:MAG: hypothetical protein P1P87_14525 [Trueperaceae bacterium]|nr:hypothetical protein [Trueperaceae bacterium]